MHLYLVLSVYFPANVEKQISEVLQQALQDYRSGSRVGSLSFSTIRVSPGIWGCCHSLMEIFIFREI